MSDIFPEDYPDFQEFGDPLCSQTDPETFFSEESFDGAINQRGSYKHEREAKLICLQCPYKARCLQYALDNPEIQGIWGGTTEHQRRSLLRGVPISDKLPPRRY